MDAGHISALRSGEYRRLVVRTKSEIYVGFRVVVNEAARGST